MKYYFLIGYEAVSTYPNIANITDPRDGDVICFDTEKNNIPELMGWINGWLDHVEITEAEFETIYNQLYPESK